MLTAGLLGRQFDFKNYMLYNIRVRPNRPSMNVHLIKMHRLVSSTANILFWLLYYFQQYTI